MANKLPSPRAQPEDKRFNYYISYRHAISLAKSIPSYLHLRNQCKGSEKMEWTCSYSFFSKPSNLDFSESSNKDQGVAQPYLRQTEMFPTISGLVNGSSSSSTSHNELHPSERFEFSNEDEMAELARRLIRDNTEKKNPTPNGL